MFIEANKGTGHNITLFVFFIHYVNFVIVDK